MLKMSWHQVTQQEKVQVPAKPAEGGLWTMVCEYVTGPVLLKFNATGSWKFDPDEGGACGPDGSFDTHIAPKDCVNKDAPVGALIGKIGNSTANAEGLKVFVVGSFCVLRVSAAESGPLFLTINDVPSGFVDNGGRLDVSVFEAQDRP